MGNIDIGLRIKQRRMALGMSQEELAMKTGYTSRAAINKIELGKVNLPQSKIIAISYALGVSPLFILGCEEVNVNNGGIISKGNDNNNAINNESIQIGEIEKEVLNLLKELNTKQKTKLLMKLYDIVEEIKSEN